MKGKILVLIIAVILVLAGAGAFFLMKKSPSEAVTDTASQLDAQNASASQPANATGEKKMNFDLSVDSDGLSKAVATFTMENGQTMKWRFYSNDAPNTVKRITQLISEGYYNGIVVHRVVPGFVVQAGDPTGTGSGGSGVKLKAEFNSRKHTPGVLSMARTSDPNSADSQFFIMLGTHPHLDGQYTIFGKVVAGEDVPKQIKQGDKIKSATIE